MTRPPEHVVLVRFDDVLEFADLWVQLAEDPFVESLAWLNTRAYDPSIRQTCVVRLHMWDQDSVNHVVHVCQRPCVKDVLMADLVDEGEAVMVYGMRSILTTGERPGLVPLEYQY